MSKKKFEKVSKTECERIRNLPRTLSMDNLDHPLIIPLLAITKEMKDVEAAEIFTKLGFVKPSGTPIGDDDISRKRNDWTEDGKINVPARSGNIGFNHITRTKWNNAGLKGIAEKITSKQDLSEIDCEVISKANSVIQREVFEVIKKYGLENFVRYVRFFVVKE